MMLLNNMDNQTKLRLDEIERSIDDLRNQIQSHPHDGVLSQQIQLDDIAGLINTVTSATELSNRTAGKPQNFANQIFIDTSTATKRLYIYDTNGNTWYKTTIT